MDKRKSGFFVKKPDFVELNNIYDGLDSLVEEYGFERVLMHLGQMAYKKVSKEFAFKIWGIVKVKDE